jgi:tRNA(Arg) A34 adenosine deaminase TadA
MNWGFNALKVKKLAYTKKHKRKLADDVLTQNALDETYMRLAIQQSVKSVQRGQTPFGAVIVYQGKIIAATHNQVWKRTDITAHAEMMALRQAGRKLKQLHLTGATLYSSCEPCPMCFAASHWARISRIVYGATIADAAHFGFNELKISDQTLVTLGRLKTRLVPKVLRAESVAVFKLWKQQQPRKAY